MKRISEKLSHKKVSTLQKCKVDLVLYLLHRPLRYNSIIREYPDYILVINKDKAIEFSFIDGTVLEVLE